MIWIGVIFVSILVHEYGHALSSRFFGQSPRIQLVPFGGVTYQEGKRVRGWREFLIVLFGPIFGFVLFIIATLLLQLPLENSPLTKYALSIFQWVNLFWTALNLIPVMPLDGGQLLRVIFESIFGPKGLKYTLAFSMVISSALGLTFFFVGYFIVGIIFFLFAFQGFDAWRRIRMISAHDQDEDLTKELKEIEELLVQNNNEAVIPRLEAMRKKAEEGIIFNIASEHLARYQMDQKEYTKVHELLKPIKKHLNPEAEYILHTASYEVADYPLVAELSGSTFKHFPDPNVALHSAEAFASLKQVEPAIGWLRAMKKFGNIDLEAITKKEIFDPIRGEISFKSLHR